MWQKSGKTRTVGTLTCPLKSVEDGTRQGLGLTGFRQRQREVGQTQQPLRQTPACVNSHSVPAADP